MDGKKKELDTGIQFFQIESFAVNFIFIDTRDECDAGFFKVNLAGGVYEAHGEDFSFEPLCLPVHSAGGPVKAVTRTNRKNLEKCFMTGRLTGI